MDTADLVSQAGGTVVHGGSEGTQRRAAVLDVNNLVTAIVLVSTDWDSQPTATRWRPVTGSVALLDTGDRQVGPGWRRDDSQWVAPAPAAPAVAPPADGDIAYGEVDQVGPPILVTLSDSGQQVEAGRLAGYTPEPGHYVKLTRMQGQWVVEDRVLLANG